MRPVTQLGDLKWCGNHDKMSLGRGDEVNSVEVLFYLWSHRKIGDHEQSILLTMTGPMQWQMINHTIPFIINLIFNPANRVTLQVSNSFTSKTIILRFNPPSSHQAPWISRGTSWNPLQIRISWYSKEEVDRTILCCNWLLWMACKLSSMYHQFGL